MLLMPDWRACKLDGLFYRQLEHVTEAHAALCDLRRRIQTWADLPASGAASSNSAVCQ